MLNILLFAIFDHLILAMWRLPWVGFRVGQFDIAQPFIQQVKAVLTILIKDETQESSIKSFLNRPEQQCFCFASICCFAVANVATLCQWSLLDRMLHHVCNKCLAVSYIWQLCPVCRATNFQQPAAASMMQASVCC